jgi:hypothetical protein
MNKRIVTLFITAILTLSITAFVAAQPNNQEQKGNLADIKTSVTLPEHAIEIFPGVFSLGYAIDEGKLVEGFAIITYKKAFGKPPWAGGPGGPDDGDDNGGDDCDYYAFLSRMMKWKTVEPYLINPSNIYGLPENTIAANFAADIDKWESAAGVDILGTGTITLEPLVAEMSGQPDNLNEVYFGEIQESGAIAITIIWGTFYAPPPRREITEWDMIFDQYDFVWSLNGAAGTMDFENIATHELGHSCGLADLYQSECSEQTMYGYAAYGETKKRSLECGDITGISDLYN